MSDEPRDGSGKSSQDSRTADELGWADNLVGEEHWADAHVETDPTPTSPPELQVISSTPDLSKLSRDTVPLTAATGEVELPHWTDPPTGEVPAVIVGDPPPGGDDLDDWSFASSSPRWRDEHTEDHKVDSFDDLAAEEPMVDEDSADDFFDFDDTAAKKTPAAADASDGGGPGRRRETRPPRAEAVAAGGAGRDLPTAAGVGLALLGLGIVAFWYRNWTAVALITVILGLAAGEYLGALRRGGFAPATLPGLVSVVALSVGVYRYGTAAYGIILSLTVLVGLLWFLVGVQRDQPVMNLGVTLLAVAHVGVLGSFAALIIRSHPSDGAAIVFAGVIATVAYDVGAFFVGRSAGRTPLSAASPNKTVEGLVGGMALAVLVSVIVVGVLDLSDFGGLGQSIWRAVLLGLVVSVAAPLGDLCESLVKRDLEVKDMGSLLPGHGGVMDRFDGMLFVLPAVYYLALFLGLF